MSLEKYISEGSNKMDDSKKNFLAIGVCFVLALIWFTYSSGLIVSPILAIISLSIPSFVSFGASYYTKQWYQVFIPVWVVWTIFFPILALLLFIVVAKL